MFQAGNVTGKTNLFFFALWTLHNAWIDLQNSMIGVTSGFGLSFLPFAGLYPLDAKLEYCLLHTLRLLTSSWSVIKFLGDNFKSCFPIKLSNFRMLTSFSHPLRQHFAPQVKRPFIKTAPADISCKGTKSCCKGLPLFQSSINHLLCWILN